eukprot:1842-Hanusia_phi.AAC.1
MEARTLQTFTMLSVSLQTPLPAQTLLCTSCLSLSDRGRVSDLSKWSKQPSATFCKTTVVSQVDTCVLPTAGLPSCRLSGCNRLRSASSCGSSSSARHSDGERTDLLRTEKERCGVENEVKSSVNDGGGERRREERRKEEEG